MTKIHAMTNHIFLKKRKGKKILLTVMTMGIAGVAAAYFYIPSEPDVSGGIIVATTTPKVKPKSVTLPFISISPGIIRQGEPALITAEGVTSTSTVKSFTFDNRPLVIFLHEGQVSALLGVDLRATPGTFPLVLTFNDGKELHQNITIGERVIIRAPFEIPEKLGGNTPESERILIYTLAQEGKIVNAIPTSNKKLWTEKFRPPLNGTLVVTDPYGYTRVTGKSTTMPHKGTDFQAAIGTTVYAMNSGVVRFTQNLRNYGNTVIVDHGLGLQTVYMHLSEINVTLGQMVERGEIVGLSGDTGYVLGPHLHLTVRVWDISIDAMKFLELLGSEN